MQGVRNFLGVLERVEGEFFLVWIVWKMSWMWKWFFIVEFDLCPSCLECFRCVGF